MDIEQTHATGKQCRLDKSRAAPRRAVRGFIAEGTISSFSNMTANVDLNTGRTTRRLPVWKYSCSNTLKETL
jgi:hypothetical protein